LLCGFKQAERVVNVLQGNGRFADLQNVVHDKSGGGLFAVNLARMYASRQDPSP
jgi:hypothetical protein